MSEPQVNNIFETQKQFDIVYDSKNEILFMGSGAETAAWLGKNYVPSFDYHIRMGREMKIYSVPEYLSRN